MGGSQYNVRSAVNTAASYSGQSYNDTFKQTIEKKIHESMDPKGISLRESRDSDIHPVSFPIIIALDLTGSMLAIPKQFIDGELVHIVSSLIQAGISNPQVLFLGIGDAECDKAPLQIGQFESGDSEMNMWLERVWPEGGGGGNAGESYNLAWFFAGFHTQHDHMDKRKSKGLLITIGDEPTLMDIPLYYLKYNDFGNPQGPKVSTQDCIKSAENLYKLLHIHVNHADNRKTNIGNFIGMSNLVNVKTTREISEEIIAAALAQWSLYKPNAPLTSEAPTGSTNEGIIM